MHRGTIFAIIDDNDNNLEIWKSTQFNGGMRIDNLGKNVYENLKDVKNISQFQQMIKDFNKEYFGYDYEEIYYKADEKSKPYINDKGEVFYNYTIRNNQLDLFYDSTDTESNSNYIKNLTNKNIEIICSNGVFVLKPEQIMITNYAVCINNTQISYGIKTDEELGINKLDSKPYIETKEEKEIINNIKKTFEKFGFNVYINNSNGVNNSLEIEKWTDGGVDMIHSLDFEDFRDLYNVNEIEKELKKLAKDFSIDDEIDLHREGTDYRKAFTISESLKDFTEYSKELETLSEFFLDKYSRICKENIDIVDEMTDY